MEKFGLARGGLVYARRELLYGRRLVLHRGSEIPPRAWSTASRPEEKTVRNVYTPVDQHTPDHKTVNRQHEQHCVIFSCQPWRGQGSEDAQSCTLTMLVQAAGDQSDSESADAEDAPSGAASRGPAERAGDHTPLCQPAIV